MERVSNKIVDRVFIDSIKVRVVSSTLTKVVYTDFKNLSSDLEKILMIYEYIDQKVLPPFDMLQPPKVDPYSPSPCDLCPSRDVFHTYP